MGEKKIQWHSGFVAAMNLELAANRNMLIYEKEYNLNTKPLEIDLLVIKKEADVLLVNEIGRLFRGYNIMEYKSPGDHLNIDTFYKASAYASLYKSYGETVDQIKADDITVSLVREKKPEGLFQYFKQRDVAVSVPFQGIYYVLDQVLFPTQIIVTGELEQKNHTWLKALTETMGKQDMKELLEQIGSLTGKFDRELADSVLEVSVRANREILEEWRGDDRMCQALMEIMEPEILEREQQAKNEGMEQGIRCLVTALRDCGHRDDEIKAAIMKNYGLTEQETEKYL